ncbi:MAG: restriction endonuclease subunit S [Spirochaetota bacterium]
MKQIQQVRIPTRSLWKKSYLGEVASFYNGRAFKSSEFKEVGTPIIRIQNLHGKGSVVYSDLALPDNKFADTGDLLFAWSATVGPFLWKGPRSIFHYHIWKVVCKSIDKIYLFYHLKFLTETLKDVGNGTLFAHITKKQIESYPILVPPKQEQIKIAKMLSCLDVKIELLLEQNQTIEELATCLFHKWFLNNRTNPKNTIKLSKRIDLAYGKSLKKALRSGTGFPVVGSNGVIDYHYKFLVQAPGIVLGRKGTIGSVNFLLENFFPIDTTFYVISKENKQPLIYEYHLLKSIPLQGMDSDSAVPGLHRQSVLGIEIPQDSQERINQFNHTCYPFYEKISTNLRQIRTLEQLRDSLLPSLITGRIQISQ